MRCCSSANDFLFASIDEVIKTLLEAFLLVVLGRVRLPAGFPLDIDPDDRHPGGA